MPVQGDFATTENFFYTRNDLSLPLPSDFDTMEGQARAICGKALQPSQQDISAMESGTANAGNPLHCFALSYQVSFLRALGVPTARGVKVKVMRKINGGDVDWALGAALMQALAGKRNRRGFPDHVQLATLL